MKKTRIVGLKSLIWNKFSDSRSSIKYIDKTGAKSWLPGYKNHSVMNKLRKLAYKNLYKKIFEINFLINVPINRAKNKFNTQAR